MKHIKKLLAGHSLSASSMAVKGSPNQGFEALSTGEPECGKFGTSAGPSKALDAQGGEAATTQVGLLSGASNIRVAGTPSFNVAGRDVHNAVINYNYDYAREVQNILKNKLNPIVNPVKKQAYCIEGTRVQIIQDLCQWVLKPDGCIAWIHGLAGSGKSAIAVSLAGKLRNMHSQVSLALTFHCVKGQETSHIFRLVPTICYYLAQMLPVYGAALIDIFHRDISLHADSIPLEEQMSLFLNPLNIIHQAQHIIIIVDGLDEWGQDKDQYDFLINLESHLRQIGWIRIIVTSRPEKEIERAMKKSQVVQSFNLTTSYNAYEDVSIFFQKSLSQWMPLGISRAHIDALTHKAGGLFIWAATALRYIAMEHDKIAGLENMINSSEGQVGSDNPYFELYALYTAILSHNPHFLSDRAVQLFQQILGIIIAAYEPLSLETLTKMVNFESNRSVNHFTVENVLKDLQAVLFKHNGKIYYHLSFAEFLCSWQCPRRFQIQIQDCHTTLAHICLKVMTKELKFNICNLETSSRKNSEVSNLEQRIAENISPELQYSALWWGHHINHGVKQTERQAAVTEFTNSPYLILWVECMSLLRSIMEIKVNGKLVIAWSKTNKNHNVESIMKELEKFVDTFSIPLYQSTPHLYISGCALLPEESILKRNMLISKRICVKAEGNEMHWKQGRHVIQTESEIDSVSFSPDGQYIVCGSNDGTVKIWNVQTGHLVGKPYQGHASSASSVAFSPDGQYVISGSYDSTLKMWNAQTGQPIQMPFSGHSNSITSVVFSPNGQQVASGSDDTTVRIWDVYTGKEVCHPLQGHTDSITMVAVSPDGQYVASGSDDTTVRVWSIKTAQLGQARGLFQGHMNSIISVAFSLDSQQVVSSADDMIVKGWNIQTGEEVGELFQQQCHHGNPIISAAFSPDSQQLVTSSDDRSVRIWNVYTGQQIGNPLLGHTDWIKSVAVSPDGQQIVSGSRDKTVRIWDVGTGDQERESVQSHINSVNCVAVSPNGEQIVSGSSDKTIRVWNLQTGQPVGNPLQGHTDWIRSVAFAPDGQQVVSGSGDSTIRIWNILTGHQVGEPLKGHTKAVNSVAFSPNGQQVVSGSGDTTVRIWNVKTGQQIGQSLQGHTDWVRSVIFLPNGQQVVSGSGDRTVRFWDVQTGKQIQEPLQGHADSVRSVACSPDGTHIASGSCDGTIRIWNAQTGEQIGEPLQGHTDWIRSVNFSPNGQQVVSASDDETIRLWNVQTGQQIGKSLQGHTDWVSSVVFSPSGKQVVSSSGDMTVRVWNIQIQQGINTPFQDHSNPLGVGFESVAHLPNSQHFTSGSQGDKTYHLTGFPLQLPPDILNGYINEQGWLYSNNHQLLLWLSPWMIGGFKDKRQMLTIPFHGPNCSIAIQWDNFVYDSHWTECWSSGSLSTKQLGKRPS
ncbi:hypothetical protein D9757_014686 [Collybiopsis confluens]|uniref:WD40 repeat-like protein n=2 Tax=Collybiopsis confluens TaxID=2823264 RepID=A0A8H5CVU3_9AGAR|nr:hypothetical protein D9757_014686 [Collybiopsis confluens]